MDTSDEEAARLGRESMQGWCWCGDATNECFEAFFRCPFVWEADVQCTRGFGHLGACQITVAGGTSVDGSPCLQVMRFRIEGFS